LKPLKRIGRLRGRFLAGAAIAVLGVILLAYEYPRFADAWAMMKHTGSKKGISPLWPPEVRARLEQEIDEVHSEFYEQSTLMGLGFLLLLCGSIVCFRTYRK